MHAAFAAGWTEADADPGVAPDDPAEIAARRAAGPADLTADAVRFARNALQLSDAQVKALIRDALLGRDQEARRAGCSLCP